MGNQSTTEIQTQKDAIATLGTEYETLNSNLQTLMGKMLTTSSVNNNFTGLSDGTSPSIVIDIDGNVVSNNTRWFSKPEIAKFLSGSSTGQIPAGPYAPAFFNAGVVPSPTNPLMTQADSFPTNSISPFALVSSSPAFFTTQPASGTNPITTQAELDLVQSLASSASVTALSASSAASLASANAITALDRVNNIADIDQSFLFVVNNVSQPIPNNLVTPVAFNAVVNQQGTSISLTNGPNGNITVNKAGVYSFSSKIVWSTNTTTQREMFYEASSYPGRRLGLTTGSAIAMTCTVVLKLAASDVVVLKVFQNTGAQINLSNDTFTSLHTEMQIMKVG
jgi:hypothetical protein